MIGRSARALTLLAALLTLLTGAGLASRTGDEPAGLVSKTAAASPGYTLFAPLELERTYLVDLKGKVVHTWRHDTQPGLNQYLLEDGTLVRAGRLKLKGPFKNAKGQGGRVEAVDWDDNLLWRLNYAVVGEGEADWNHANAIDYKADLDQIMISLRSHSEVWVIDHRISADEARGPTRGLLFPHGNPAHQPKRQVA